MTSMLVTVIGLSAVLAQRVQRRTINGASDAVQARYCAEAGIDLALHIIEQVPQWRHFYPHDVWFAPQAMGGGTVKWKLRDEADGNIANGDTDPVRIVAWGMVGDAIQKVSVVVEPAPGEPLDVLQTAIYATGDITASSTVTAVGGPFATAGVYTNNGETIGDVEAALVVNLGIITGTITEWAPPRDMPSGNVFDTYHAMATEIPFVDTMQMVLLSSASNPYGPVSPNGVYYINVPPLAILQLDKVRIVATLVVDLGLGATLRTKGSVVWDSPGDNYPILVVNAGAGAQLDLNGTTQPLKEGNTQTNFNPPGTPYNGESDSDIADVYPAELHGLIHVLGPAATVNMGSGIQVRGTVVAEGYVLLGSGTDVIIDPRIYQDPPPGYTAPSTEMGIVPGSWEHVVD